MPTTWLALGRGTVTLMLMWAGPCECFPELLSKQLLEVATPGCKKQLGTAFFVFLKNTASKKIAEYFLSLHFYLFQITTSCSFFEINLIGRKIQRPALYIVWFSDAKCLFLREIYRIPSREKISFSLDPLKQEGVLSTEEQSSFIGSSFSVVCIL